MARQDILTDFAIRLDQMNAQHQHMALPAIDDPTGLADTDRINHLECTLAALVADVKAGRDPDDRLLRNVGAHALAWLDVVRTRNEADLPTQDIPVAPADGGQWQEFSPRDAA